MAHPLREGRRHFLDLDETMVKKQTASESRYSSGLKQKKFSEQTD